MTVLLAMAPDSMNCVISHLHNDWVTDRSRHHLSKTIRDVRMGDHVRVHVLASGCTLHGQDHPCIARAVPGHAWPHAVAVYVHVFCHSAHRSHYGTLIFGNLCCRLAVSCVALVLPVHASRSLPTAPRRTCEQLLSGFLANLSPYATRISID